ncbi:MAG: leucine-rich repeat domain-containing protein, partial [Verrucomicrobiota bacterium]
NITPLEGIPFVRLNLGSWGVSDLTPLKGMPLKHLYISSTKVQSLQALADLPLGFLGASHLEVNDLAPLSGIKTLKKLELANTRMKDLTGLSGLRLEELDISRSSVVDLSPLRGMPLKALILNNTEITDLSPLRGMPLEKLEMRPVYDLKDLTPLRGMPLKDLKVNSHRLESSVALSGMNFDELWLELSEDADIRAIPSFTARIFRFTSDQDFDVDWLADYPLEELFLRVRRFENFEKLGDFKNVKALDLKAENIVDISCFRGLALKEVGLHSANITHLEPLRGMKIETLNISHSKVRDIRALEDMELEELYMHGCEELTDISVLRNFKRLGRLSIPESAENIEFLRDMEIAYISYTSSSMRAAEFWRRYDQKAER